MLRRTLGQCPKRHTLRSSLRSRAQQISTGRTRCISIQATPASSSPSLDPTEPAITSLDVSQSAQGAAGITPDARFEVLGTSSSLLSATLSASQNLYTRRGTLVGVSGSPDNAISSLSPLSPLLRAALGVPFLYQKISSSTPLNLLVATKALHTSISVLNLDGRVDWQITQRNGLLAWSGHTLTVTHSANLRMSLAHWGNSTVTGRGLVALAAAGNTYQITLKAEEQYVAHPSSVLAYTLSPYLPQPHRFRSSTLRLQLPGFASGLLNAKFFREVRTTRVYRFLAGALFNMRILGRRTVFGDRLFLRFQGPTTILLQSRGSRLRDALTADDASEVAQAGPGVLGPMPRVDSAREAGKRSGTASSSDAGAQHSTATTMSYASVGTSGNVSWSGR